MAKISAHGTCAGTIDTLTARKRYMSDGWILRNQGFGWKRHARAKPGFTAEDMYRRATERLNATLAERPALAAYRAALHQFSLAARWQVHAAVRMMPDDADGVWALLDDQRVKVDLDELIALCVRYRAALAEGAI